MDILMDKDEEIHIELELDCGLVVDFLPDWRMPAKTHADHSKVRWQLSIGTDKDSLDGVLSFWETEESLYRPSSIMESVRLLYRYDKGTIDT